MNMKKILCTLFTTCIFTSVFNCSDDSSDEKNYVELNQKVVSTEWLSSNLNKKDLVVIDVRSSEEFSLGHIKNSINMPFAPVSDWSVSKGDLLVELPEIAQLTGSIGSKGISIDNKIILVTSLPTQDNPYSLSSTTRAALTLAFAGVKDVAILDGSYEKWVNEGKEITTSATLTSPVTFTANTNSGLFVDINYVKNNANSATIVDARDSAVYSGTVIEPFANKAGHIPGALSLPAPSMWNTDGTYKSAAEIQGLASGIIGTDKNKEIIVYCGVGGYASTIWFTLTQILDYQNVKVFDGSAQEWVIENEMACDRVIVDQKVVSTEWLNTNLNKKGLVVIDVRSDAEFALGHIKNSINMPFSPVSDWSVSKGDLLVELPEIAELSVSLGSKGISVNSKIVLVTSLPTQDNPYSLSSTTRAALTLAFAGVKDVAILDGSYEKWANEGKEITTDATLTSPVTFTANTNSGLFVDINYVKTNTNSAIIVDARDSAVYSGTVIEPFANDSGHIPGAVSLPAPSMWNTDGTYKNVAAIETLASSIAGTDINKEIIVYCGVGGYASTIWFTLTQILDYKNVKVFDGSAQEWVIDNDLVKSE